MMTSRPRSTKKRGANASSSRLPLAKPFARWGGGGAMMRGQTNDNSELQQDALHAQILHQPTRSTNKQHQFTYLVGDIEKGNVSLGLDEIRDLGPLLARGVDARGVVRAAVQEDDGALGRGLDVGLHRGKVQPHRLGVEVGVLTPLHAWCRVVCPRDRVTIL